MGEVVTAIRDGGIPSSWWPRNAPFIRDPSTVHIGLQAADVTSVAGENELVLSGYSGEIEGWACVCTAGIGSLLSGIRGKVILLDGPCR